MNLVTLAESRAKYAHSEEERQILGKLEQLSEQPLTTEELNFSVSQPPCTHLLNYIVYYMLRMKPSALDS